MKISKLLRKTREFYSVDRNRWGKGALRNADGSYCLLGAAASVVTNKEAIDTLTWADLAFCREGYNGGQLAEFVHYDELPNVKGRSILREFEIFFAEHVGHLSSVEGWNDVKTRTRAEVLAQLRRLEKIALEEGQ